MWQNLEPEVTNSLYCCSHSVGTSTVIVQDNSLLQPVLFFVASCRVQFVWSLASQQLLIQYTVCLLKWELDVVLSARRRRVPRSSFDTHTQTHAHTRAHTHARARTHTHTHTHALVRPDLNVAIHSQIFFWLKQLALPYSANILRLI